METVECIVMVEIGNLPAAEYPSNSEVTYSISKHKRFGFSEGRICSHNMHLHELKWQMTFEDRIHPIICKKVIPDIARIIMLYCCDELFIYN